jgi:hypothetical protein
MTNNNNLQNQEVLRLVVHDINISKSTKEPTVTLELYFQNDDGDWQGSGKATFAKGHSMSLFAEAIGYPVPWHKE